MAEVHLVGSLTGASGFPSPNLTCKFAIRTGEDWKLLEGDEFGQTHVDLPEDSRLTVWSHPIDVHYATSSIKGWPKIILQVYHQDMFGRNELYGYGFAHIPTAPGAHTVEIQTWRPVGSFVDQLYAFFLGATPQLKNLDLIANPSERFRLETVTMGKVYLELSVVTRNFEFHGVAL